MTSVKFERLAAAALPNFWEWYAYTYRDEDDNSIYITTLLGCLAHYAEAIYRVKGGAGNQILDNVATLLEVAVLAGGELQDAVTTGFFEGFSSKEGSGADFRSRLGEAAQGELLNLLSAKVGAFDPFTPENGDRV